MTYGRGPLLHISLLQRRIIISFFLVVRIKVGSGVALPHRHRVLLPLNASLARRLAWLEITVCKIMFYLDRESQLPTPFNLPHMQYYPQLKNYI